MTKSHAADRSAAFRALPKVDEALEISRADPALAAYSRSILAEAIRADIETARQAIQRGELDAAAVRRHFDGPFGARLAARLARQARPRYARAINATGVVLHTGLGRAPLPEEARQAVAEASRYAILELDRDTGKRNRREDAACDLMKAITGCAAATVVNNNAAATLIALAAVAAGKEVIVARGQLVEIGGSFRIPDILEESGCRLVEVGATNKVRLSDYEKAITEDTGLILKVHTSNFKIVGFTQEVPIEELAALGAAHDIPVMDDLGSGSFIDLSPYGLEAEPRVQDSIRRGADIVTFSGDKLLGGPQAGLIIGGEAPLALMRKHPLYRAMRPDKLTLAALEATLALYRDSEQALSRIPALAMISASRETLRARAERLLEGLSLEADVELVDETSKVGGGAYAVSALPTCAIALRPRNQSLDRVAAALRDHDPAVFVRRKDEQIFIDPRTILPADEEALRSALSAVLGAA